MEAAAEGIKIIHDVELDDDPFPKVRQLIGEARNVFFLGFGYGVENLKKLGLTKRKDQQVYWGTAYGLSPLQTALIARDAGQVIGQSNLFNVTCSDFLTRQRELS